MSGFFRNLPNILTILRMAAVPLFAVFMLKDNLAAAAIVFLAAELTDVADGIIARRYNLITTFGKLADPFADKLMQLTALFLLSAKGMILRIVPWLVLSKDLFLLISGFWVIKCRKKIDVSSKWFGKLTSVILFIAIMLSFLGVPRTITDPIFWLCVAMALFTAVMYICNYFKQTRAAQAKK